MIPQAITRSFVQSQRYQQRYGIRRLLVLSGQPDWCNDCAQQLTQALVGDWLWLSDAAPMPVASLPPARAHTLLGQEYLHAVFDARTGLDAQALAILTGTLLAGSWLILLTPEWDAWPDCPDDDSLRWSEQPEAIATPNFIRHLQRQLLRDDEVVLWREQDGPATIPQPFTRPDWQPASGAPTASQQAALERLLRCDVRVSVISAPRGRGKSTLAGMLARQCQGTCWVSAPSRAAGDTLLRACGDRAVFFAPDALLAYCQQQHDMAADWLLIDEAAAIPASLLSALLSYFRRVVMITTVLGYEGTGRGFLLKFCASLPDWQMIELTSPLRFAGHDPLERIIDRVMLFDAEKRVPERLAAPFSIEPETPADWLHQPERLAQCYGLLCSAHYRTSPLDLRRLLDAPGMHVVSARAGQQTAGVIWLVDEGGLPPALAWEVWAGRRRPRGSLVAQSLAAHGNLWQAPVLRSRRISRIAVLAAHREQGIGQSLVVQQQQQAYRAGVDFLSVSFGFEQGLWRFWQRCGFLLVRIGSHIEASSGCYSAMAILPLSEAGRALAITAQDQLARDWFWLQRDIPLSLPGLAREDDTLTPDDWRNLAGFARAQRTAQACQGALSRLVAQSSLPLVALRQWLEQGMAAAQSVQHLQLAGRKALIQRWRQEAAEALCQLDALQWQHWRDTVGPL
ncbi:MULTISPECIES: tRNA(Met) cytidine acetyltransferase TmcA [Dickeya]|uniref:tRNA(Met) cytidine acetyltransferase TmcA n=1 Tax=Dickeya aquatica TaxID=1401087 RepID=A0A375AD35_9GAMM|nr:MULTISPECIES: GNAT family N-acetyltransferase [Dickeya]SLM63897.1 tRNA(Met) Cytidine Acetyltransferase. Elongator methionine tRNA (ac4C34) acetyltransferase; tRNA N(4)-acetylcytidine acetyltransferase [Dickeya aquatica]